MLVRITQSFSGPLLTARRGQELELDNAIAKGLIDAGRAEPVKAAPKTTKKEATGGD